MSYDRGFLHDPFPDPPGLSLGAARCANREGAGHSLQGGSARTVLNRTSSQSGHLGLAPLLIQQSLPSGLKGRHSTDLPAACLPRRPVLPFKEGQDFQKAARVHDSRAAGSLDPTEDADLRGCSVLVVEDDFCLAAYTRHALCRAGAEVLGPVAHEDQALALIDARTPTCALLDINLGKGARFGIADVLRERGVPFMFVTGYDDVIIPGRFNDIGRIRKPSGFRLVVRAAAQMYHPTP